MENLKNQLPVAVHQVGGGEARVRTGNMVISLDGLTSGSFSTGTATKIRVVANFRTNGDIIVLLSYGSNPSYSNAECLLQNSASYTESISGPLMIHWRLLDMIAGTDRTGGTDDYLYVTFYE